MKRYNPEPYPMGMKERPHGTWVRRDDMLKAMNWLIDELWSDLHEVDREQLIKEAMEQ